jgi:hypothetical protein
VAWLWCSANDEDALRLASVDFLQERSLMLGIRGAEAEIHEVHALRSRPMKGGEKGAASCAEFSIEYSGCENLAGGGFFQNCGGHCGAVAQPIDEVHVHPARLVDPNSAFDALDVGIADMDPTVDDHDSRTFRAFARSSRGSLGLHPCA